MYYCFMFLKVIIELNKFGILFFWNRMQHIGTVSLYSKICKNQRWYNEYLLVNWIKHFQVRFQKILTPIVGCMPPSSRQSVTPSRQILPVLWVITVVRVSPRQKDHTMTDISKFCPKIIIPFFTLNTVNLGTLTFMFRKSTDPCF